MIKINKIKLQNFRFFADDEQNNTFEIDGQNALIYGENGSGKSSLFKAFEFLSTPSISIDAFREQKNIFKSNDETYLEFEFSNDETLRIDEDHLSLDGSYNFIEKLSVSRPLLDYKSLLQITYEGPPQGLATEKNLYSFFDKILEDYPIENDKTLKDLKGQAYFDEYKRIIEEDLFENINTMLEKFKHDFKIIDIIFDSFDKTVFLKIDFFDQDIGKYHLFLNEARLSALAMSVYFAIIKKQFGLLDSDSLKILVLDDLLISLDMNNRMNLIDILKSEFGDYQIFFFTHDKGLFEVFKDKMNWKAFEIYTDKCSNGHEIPFINPSESYKEIAQRHFDNRDYPACANYLRKEVERLAHSYLGLRTLDGALHSVKIKDNYEELEKCFPKLVGALKGFENCHRIPEGQREQKCVEFANIVLQAVEEIKKLFEQDRFHDINSIKDRILNPQSHADESQPLYRRELEDAIRAVEALGALLLQ